MGWQGKRPLRDESGQTRKSPAARMAKTEASLIPPLMLSVTLEGACAQGNGPCRPGSWYSLRGFVGFWKVQSHRSRCVQRSTVLDRGFRSPRFGRRRQKKSSSSGNLGRKPLCSDWVMVITCSPLITIAIAINTTLSQHTYLEILSGSNCRPACLQVSWQARRLCQPS